MIEFKGELSEACKCYIQKNMTKRAFFCSLIITLILSIILVVFGILWEWLVTLFIIIPVLITIFTLIPQINAPIKTLNLYIPKKLVIKDQIISIECDRISEIRLLENVKKVIDCEKWYHIIFYLGYKSFYFICQKNLLSKGTIQEFETLFKDKIQTNIK